MHARLIMALAFVIAAVSPAVAQYAPGSIGNGGRMPETMSPGALPPPTISAPSTPVAPPSASYGSRYPNTETLSRDRIESQGYRVERITPQNNGSWKAETTRDAVPTRPQGVPNKVTIFPDGRVLEEREPLTVNPPRP
jgi:hypothetical protein